MKGDSEYWDFPKGHREKREKKESTALREVKEETGLSVSIIKGYSEDIVYFFRQKADLVKKIVTYFVSIAKTDEVKISSEHYGYKWVTAKEAQMLITHPSSKKILNSAVDFYNSQQRLDDFN